MAGDPQEGWVGVPAARAGPGGAGVALEGWVVVRRVAEG